MSKVQRKSLEIGPESENIGTNKVRETPERTLLSEAPQNITGAKTAASPVVTLLYPQISTDAVSKKALLDGARCIAEETEEVLTVTAQDVLNGYCRLSKNIAPGQDKSLKIVYFEGAGALSQGQDFASARFGGESRLVWDGWPMGRPGRVSAGQKIFVRYNTCREPIIQTFDPYRGYFLDSTGLTLDSVENYAQVTTLIDSQKIFITPSMSGMILKFTNIGDGRKIQVRLPTIGAGSWFFLSAAAGRLMLYTVPQAVGSRYLYYDWSPEMVGKFEVYAYDGIGWEKVISEEMPTAFTSDTQLVINNYTMGIKPICDVIALGDEQLGVYCSWDGFYILGDNYPAVPPVADVRIFSKDFVQVSSRTVKLSTKDWWIPAYSRNCVISRNRLLVSGYGCEAGESMLFCRGYLGDGANVNIDLNPFGVPYDKNIFVKNAGGNLSLIHQEGKNLGTVFPASKCRQAKAGEQTTNRYLFTGRYCLVDDNGYEPSNSGREIPQRGRAMEAGERRILGVYDIENKIYKDLGENEILVSLINENRASANGEENKAVPFFAMLDL